jgi:small subunit ribosomal protein S20
LPPKAPPKKNLSALKRVRQAEKRRMRNRAMKTAIKTIAKKVEAAVANKDREGAQRTLREAMKLISKAASKGILHRNTASRKISRLSKITDTLLKSEAA